MYGKFIPSPNHMPNNWKTQGTKPGQIFDPGSFAKDAANQQINMYEQGTYSWDPSLMENPQPLMNQNYDQMRQRAMGQVNAGVQSGTQTAMSSLAATGGLSAADRAALQAQGQRQRVNMGQGAVAGYDQLQAQNMYDTSKYNIGQQQKTMDLNQQMMNARARDMATQNEQRSVNIYQQRLREAMLERQLDAARKIAQEQGA